MIARIAAQYSDVHIAELVKTVTLGNDNVHYRLEMYYSHRTAEAEPYFAMLFREEINADSDGPEGVWVREADFPSCDNKSLDGCLEAAVETLRAHILSMRSR